MTDHPIEKVRNETRRRVLTVSETTSVTPNMLRVIFTSPDLYDFSSKSADDHIKLFIKDPSVPGGVASRDYTPRSYDPASGTLSIDFALHEGGAATTWARRAKPGDELEIGGPRGSTIVHDTFDHYLLIGDATALPAIARRTEELRAGVPVTTIVVVESPEDEQKIDTQADWRPIWIHRADHHGDDAALVRAALTHWQTPAGDGYVWIAGEARMAKALREYMVTERQQPKAWLRAAGYWVAGAAGASERFDG